MTFSFKTRLTLALPCLLLLGACTHSLPTPSIDLMIENVSVIDAVGGERAGMDVGVFGGKIVAVLATDDNTKKIDASVKVDGTGKYLIPGLWDAHVHLTYAPGLNHEVFFPLSLAHGVTSLRDTGGHLDQLVQARAISDSDAVAPNLFVSGPLIDGANPVYNGRSASNPNLALAAATPEDGARIVDELAAEGVDLIKAYEMLSPETFQTVVDRAAFHNLPVTAHSPVSMTAREAIRSGISDMQHLRNLEMDCTSDPIALRQERRAMLEANEAPHAGALRSSIHAAQRSNAVANIDENSCDELVQLMLENGVSQTPTLTVSTFMSEQLYAQPRWQKSFALIPAKIGASWLARAQAIQIERDANTLAYDQWLREMVVRLNKAGVPLLAGTDAPIGFLTPGASLHEELALLVAFGLSPADALRAATFAPAQFFGLENEMGSIAEGMRADLVLLNKNPLVDIRNTAEIDAVFKDGVHLDRAVLNELMTKPASEN